MIYLLVKTNDTRSAFVLHIFYFIRLSTIYILVQLFYLVTVLLHHPVFLQLFSKFQFITDNYRHSLIMHHDLLRTAFKQKSLLLHRSVHQYSYSVLFS